MASLLPTSGPASRQVSVHDRYRAAVELLRSPAAYGTSLLVLFLDRYGTEADEDGRPLACLHWHPAVVRRELEDDFGVTLSRGNFDRLMAAVSVVASDRFFRHVPSFVAVCNALAGDEFDPEEFDPADVMEMAWAVTEACLLWPPDHDEPAPFSNDVRRYIGLALRREGFIRPPGVLKIALGGDRADVVARALGADPDLADHAAAVQAGRVAEVEQTVRACLVELLGQVTTLPLSHGSADHLRDQILSLSRQGAS